MNLLPRSRLLGRVISRKRRNTGTSTGRFFEAMEKHCPIIGNNPTPSIIKEFQRSACQEGCSVQLKRNPPLGKYLESLGWVGGQKKYLIETTKVSLGLGDKARSCFKCFDTSVLNREDLEIVCSNRERGNSHQRKMNL
jgi:hypothetical protein